MEKTAQPMNEDQYKFPRGNLRRRQSAYRSSFNKTRSFGGVIKDSFANRLSKSLKAIMEEPELDAKSDIEPDAKPDIIDAVKPSAIMEVEGVKLNTHDGRMEVDGHTITGLDNHTNVLRAIVWWLSTRDMESLKKAIAGIGKMAREGTEFK
jgi:hypothetical protein